MSYMKRRGRIGQRRPHSSSINRIRHGRIQATQPRSFNSIPHRRLRGRPRGQFRGYFQHLYSLYFFIIPIEVQCLLI